MSLNSIYDKNVLVFIINCWLQNVNDSHRLLIVLSPPTTHKMTKTMNYLVKYLNIVKTLTHVWTVLMLSLSHNIVIFLASSQHFSKLKCQSISFLSYVFANYQFVPQFRLQKVIIYDIANCLHKAKVPKCPVSLYFGLFQVLAP